MAVDQTSPRLYTVLLAVARRFWPGLDELPAERQIIGTGEIIACLYSLPAALVGLVWLVLLTDLNWALSAPGTLLLFAGLIVIFNRLSFFLIIELRENRYGSADGALTGIPLWAGIFLFGPTILWIVVAITLVQFLVNWQRNASTSTHWGQLRSLSMNLASETLAPILAFKTYLAIGGQFPLQSLAPETIGQALVSFLANFLAYAVLWVVYLVYHTWAQQILTHSNRVQPVIRFFLLATSLPQMANPFAILAAGLYAQNGQIVFIFFMAGMLMVAYLARRLSWSAERSRQQSRLLDKIEKLGRAIIDASPDAKYLPEILEQHLVNMFPAGRLVIWIFPSEVYFKLPQDWQPELDRIWPWLLDRSKGVTLTAREKLPWNEELKAHNPVIIAPIRTTENEQTFGGIYLELHTLAQPWDRKALQNLCPAVQALAAQIASALNQVNMYEQAIEYQRVSQELKLAGSIQSSMLPYSFPTPEGWQFAVTLAPAGETSGDFFDIIMLPDGRIGLVIADVLDKGVGPALYMMLSRTLIRTYATEFDLQPEVVFFATNERILKDTRANLFVTAFYGVLDLYSGELNYSNAGHNPPYLLSSQNGNQPIGLTKTGFPIGIDEEATWEGSKAQINPGDVLVLYTDGIPEAQSEDGEFFREDKLVKIIQENLGETAEVLQSAILDAVYDFMGDAAPFDDITLMILIRDPE
ncbi:MAG: PP2C family protein-serine/threonine phosphatase [Anaerolineales bacterium]|nr:PP2C family protein-serine/threonine phosphatase [Anaerolineales bacterium]